jgi:hypothetical protein
LRLELELAVSFRNVLIFSRPRRLCVSRIHFSQRFSFGFRHLDTLDRPETQLRSGLVNPRAGHLVPFQNILKPLSATEPLLLSLIPLEAGFVYIVSSYN